MNPEPMLVWRKAPECQKTPRPGFRDTVLMPTDGSTAHRPLLPPYTFSNSTSKLLLLGMPVPLVSPPISRLDRSP